MVKIMPINRIATRADLDELITGFDYLSFDKRQEKNPTQPVEKLLLVCMGHEPDLAAELEKGVPAYKLDIQVMDILRQKSELEFKREAEAKIVRHNGPPDHRAVLPDESPPEVKPHEREHRKLA